MKDRGDERTTLEKLYRAIRPEKKRAIRNDRSGNGERLIDGHFWLLNDRERGPFAEDDAKATAKARRERGIKCRVIKLGVWDYGIYDRLDCVHGARFKKGEK